MSVRLCCWKQNEGVSGTDPGSSRVYPEETVREDEPNVPCSKIYPTCEDYCSALKLQSPVAGKWSCVCIKARAEAHVITVYFVSHHLTQAFSSDSLSAHRLVTVLFCSLLHSMFFSHHDVIPSINFFYAYWQSCCVTTLTNCSSHQQVLYLCLGSDTLSLYPEVFSWSCCTTTAYASMSKHRLRFSFWKTYWIFRSQPVRQSRQRVSLCLVAAATSC